MKKQTQTLLFLYLVALVMAVVYLIMMYTQKKSPEIAGILLGVSIFCLALAGLKNIQDK
jgi:FtsH-binding integral membrane protein